MSTLGMMTSLGSFVSKLKVSEMLGFNTNLCEEIMLPGQNVTISPGMNMSAMYAGPIAQQIFDQMQADMDKIAQGDLFGEVKGIGLVPTDVERCVEWRSNYYQDMIGFEGFEEFQDMYSFEHGYKSEDPHRTFTLPPSKAAYEAYLQF